MKLLRLLIAILFLCIGLFYACQKEDKILPSDVMNSSALKGSIVGFVLAGGPGDSATVSLVGTSYTTTTSSSGRFELNDIPTGTYTIKCTKPGYDYAISQVLVTGNGTVSVGYMSLYLLPTDRVISLVHAGLDASDSSYLFTVTLKGNHSSAFRSNLIFAFSDKAKVNMLGDGGPIQYKGYITWDALILNMVFPLNNPVLQFKITKKEWRQHIAYDIGSRMYLKAFFVAGNNRYLDTDTGLYFWTNYSLPSEEINFFMSF